MFAPERHSECSPVIHLWVRTLELSGLLLVAGWVFAECWNHPFHFDDALFLQSPQVTDPGDPWYMLRPSQSRPLTYLTFYANYRFGGANPRGYHLVNWMIHLTNVALVYGLVLLLARRFPGTIAGRLGRWLPLIAASVFALHPVQSEAVNYVYQRSTLLATLFVLASLLTFLWSERINRRWLAYPWVVGFWLLAVAGKESALVLPLVFVVYLWAHSPDRPSLKRSIGKVRGLLVFMVGLAAGGAGWSLYNLAASDEKTLGFGTEEWGSGSYLVGQISVAVTYLRFIMWPAGHSIDHDPEYHGLGSWVFWASLLLLSMLVAWALRLKRIQPTASFLILSFFALLAPTSSIIPSADAMFEHRLYLPMVAGSAALAWCYALLAGRMVQGRKWRTLVVLVPAIAAGILYSARSRERTWLWRDNVGLWEEAAEVAPAKARVHYNLGVSYLGVDPARARAEFLKTIELKPDHGPALYNMGWLEQRQARRQSAEIYYRQALEADPGYWQVHQSLGNIAVVSGRVDEAIREFEATARIKKDYWPAFPTLATLYLRKGNLVGARRALERLRSLRPELIEGRYLVSTLLVAERRLAEAEDELRALEIADQEGNYKRQIKELRQAIQLQKEPGVK